MMKYPGAVPPDYLEFQSEEDSDCQDDDNQVHKFTKTQFPETGSFDVSLDYATELICAEICQKWKKSSSGSRESKEIIECLGNMLRHSSNPFVLCLKIIASYRLFPIKNSLPTMTLEVLKSCKANFKTNFIDQCLREDKTKLAAFYINILHKNLSIIKLTVEAFELVKSNHLFLDKIKSIISQRRFKEAGQLACELNLCANIAFEDLLLPLLLCDKIGIFHDYLDKAHKYQTVTIKFLDLLMEVTEPGFALRKCQPLLDKYFIKDVNKEKFDCKTIHKLINKLQKKYCLDPSTAPNNTRYSVGKNLRFIFNCHLVDQKSSKSAFEDNIKQFVLDNGHHGEVLRLCVKFGLHDYALRLVEKYKISPARMPFKLHQFIKNGCVALPEHKQLTSKTASTRSFQISALSDDGWSDDESESPKEPEKFYELSLDPSRILMVDSVIDFWKMLHRLKTDNIKVVGIDSEHTAKETASIIQIATFKNIFIIDLLTLKDVDASEDCWRQLGVIIFNNDEIIKIGFDFSKDIEILQKFTPLGIKPSSSSCKDLQIVGKQLLSCKSFKFPFQGNTQASDLSLSKLTHLCFGKKLDKGNQLSNWSQRPLRQEQICYAALDAFVLLEIQDIITITENKESKE